MRKTLQLITLNAIKGSECFWFISTAAVINVTRRLALFGHSDTLNVVASDHRPFTIKQRAMGKDDFTKIPHGLPGIQDRMSVIWEKGVVCVALLFLSGCKRSSTIRTSVLVWGLKT